MVRHPVHVTPAEMTEAFDEVFDQAVLFHGYSKSMRDYDFYLYATADPSTGTAPEHLRYRFTCCVLAEATTTVPAEIWRRSLDPRLLDYEKYLAESEDLDGYVWGVNWQAAYPGGFALATQSSEAARWSADLGIPFHDATFEGNGHRVRLVFSDLEVSLLGGGSSAFTVPEGELPADGD